MFKTNTSIYNTFTLIIQPKCKYIMFMFHITFVITKILYNISPITIISYKVYSGVLSYTYGGVMWDFVQVVLSSIPL